MQKIQSETPDTFQAVTAPQIAVFRISRGWTGGFGEAVLDDDNRAFRVGPASVYVNGSSLKQIMEKVVLPDCYVGTATIKVSAKVHLEMRKERNYSIPGAPEKSYYALIVDELYDVYSFAQPCE